MENDTLINTLNEVFEPALVQEMVDSNMIMFGSKMKELYKDDAVNFIPIVLEGSVRVFNRDKNGCENLLYNIEKYESCIIGLTSSLKQIETNLVAVANDNSKVLYLNPANIKDWINKYESWRTFMINLYQKRLVELLMQHDLVADQRDEISTQHKSITDSIHYAKRIQTAALPPKQLIDKLLSDYFILFKPKDIVSGDYYWVGELEGKVIIAAADCTGHGVPGAFMSMLGMAFMNEIINQKKLSNPNQILDELRKQVKISLRQEGMIAETKDGMDIALVILDKENMCCYYSGANNPLYLIRDGELIITKADKMPIGIHHNNELHFTNHEIKLEKGDCLYMFSDGYVDQFGGEKSRKFKSKAFKELLIENYSKPMSQQKEILDQTIEDWRGDYEQIDDILVMGIKI